MYQSSESVSTNNNTGLVSRPEQFSESEFTRISYGDVKLGQKGGKSAFVGYCGKPLLLQTPMMLLPFGVNVFQKEGEEDQYSLNLSFGGYEDNEKIRAFKQFGEYFDNKILTDACSTHSLKWFTKKMMNREVVEALYTPMVKYSKNKETGEINTQYPPTINIKVRCKEGRFLCDVYDSNRNKIADPNLLELIPKGSMAQALIRCNGMWFVGGKFGCTWSLVQIKVIPPPRLEGYGFIDDEPASAEEDIVVDSDHERSDP